MSTSSQILKSIGNILNIHILGINQIRNKAIKKAIKKSYKLENTPCGYFRRG